jgi:hypothetical protein
MNHLPRLRARSRMNAQPPGRVICPGHCKVVRTKYQCAIAGRTQKTSGEVHECYGRIDPHHVSSRGAGGGDHQVAPLCRKAHDLGESPNWSWLRFKAEYGVDLEKMAEQLWLADAYHRLKFERDWREMWGDAPLPY